MRQFTHINAYTVNEACGLLRRYQGKAKLNAGGTDLLSMLKGDIWPEYPEAVINVKTIPGLDSISEDENVLKIGALALLSDVAKSPIIKEKCGTLVKAALSVGSPLVRNLATIGGNLCQAPRCWYYRYPRRLGGPLPCLRKGTGPCLAMKGDNRYHAILEGKGCFAVCTSDIAVALAALDAKITIVSPKGERSISVVDFYQPLSNTLEIDEMIKDFQIPTTMLSMEQRFLKFTLRKPIDFAIVSVAASIGLNNGVCTDARIILGAVAPMPFRAKAAEETIVSQSISDNIAAEAAEKALANAKPLSMNAYKVKIAKTLVRRAITGPTAVPEE
jgi:xanthine dehydrogenase YagS FAD-binding subunit